MAGKNTSHNTLTEGDTHAHLMEFVSGLKYIYIYIKLRLCTYFEETNYLTVGLPSIIINTKIVIKYGCYKYGQGQAI